MAFIRTKLRFSLWRTLFYRDPKRDIFIAGPLVSRVFLGARLETNPALILKFQTYLWQRSPSKLNHSDYEQQIWVRGGTRPFLVGCKIGYSVSGSVASSPAFLKVVGMTSVEEGGRCRRCTKGRILFSRDRRVKPCISGRPI